MDILLPILQFLFFAPIVARLASQSGWRAKAELRERRKGLRQPGIVIHVFGGLLLFGSTSLALFRGRIDRYFTPHGAFGAAIVVGAAVLFSWALVTFRSWRLIAEVDADHELCNRGPYRLVRHPIYLAIDLFAVGVAIWVPISIVVIAAVMLVVGGEVRARAEEKVLLAAFGDKYRDYANQVRLSAVSSVHNS